jgi:hypothetical protein
MQMPKLPKLPKLPKMPKMPKMPKVKVFYRFNQKSGSSFFGDFTEFKFTGHQVKCIHIK